MAAIPIVALTPDLQHDVRLDLEHAAAAGGGDLRLLPDLRQHAARPARRSTRSTRSSCAATRRRRGRRRRSCGCRGRCRSSSPGLKIASSGAVIAAIVSEYFGGLQKGLGPAHHLGRGGVGLPAGLGDRDGRDRARPRLLPRRGACRAPGDALATTTRRTLVSRFLHRPRGRPRWRPACWRWPHAEATTTALAARRRRRRRRQVADQGQAAAAVVHAGAVRRVLRRAGGGLLQGRGARRPDPRGRHRHRAPDPARPGPGRLRHRVGAQGAAVARAGRRHHRRRPDLPALGHAPGLLQGQGHHHGRRPQGQEGRQLGLRQRVRAVRRA